MPTLIKGEGMILYVHDGTAYLPLVCLTSNNISQTRNIIEAQTKCTPGVVIKTNGTLSNEVSFEGIYAIETDGTDYSYNGLFDLMNSGDTVNWKMDSGVTTPAAYFGEGVFSNLELSAPAGDEYATFSGTLAISGDIVTTDPITP